MKRKFILLVCALYFSVMLAGAKIIEIPDAIANMTVGIISGSVPAGGGGESCPENGSPDLSNATNDASWGVTDDNARYYHGMYFTPGSNRQICKVAFRMYKDSGDISGYTYTATIRASTALSTIITNGTSAGVSGATIPVDAEMIYFTFATPPSLTSGTKYAIVVNGDTVDGSNYAKASFVDGSTTALASWIYMDNTYSLTDRTDKEATFELYYYD